MAERRRHRSLLKLWRRRRWSRRVKRNIYIRIKRFCDIILILMKNFFQSFFFFTTVSKLFTTLNCRNRGTMLLCLYVSNYIIQTIVPWCYAAVNLYVNYFRNTFSIPPLYTLYCYIYQILWTILDFSSALVNTEGKVIHPRL